jgi:tetrahydromethanopterin S-methyltransferase subunit G
MSLEPKSNPTGEPTPHTQPTPSDLIVRPAEVRLTDVSDAELRRIATELGLDARGLIERSTLVAAIQDRRALIANLNRDALLDVMRWAGRRANPIASNEQLAVEIAQVKSMRFSGLSHRGLVALGRLRGIACDDAMPTPEVIARLKEQEGFLAKLGRKRRSMIGKLVSKLLGDDEPANAATHVGRSIDTQNRPDANANRVAGANAPHTASARAEADRPIQHEIEESGLIAGISSRVKRSADQYINQKLDEIEQRIDRKLDEIDRRLGEWRDKEIANRIRILKISLWATVIVAIVTLLISYLRVYWWQAPTQPTPRDATPARVESAVSLRDSFQRSREASKNDDEGFLFGSDWA